MLNVITARAAASVKMHYMRRASFQTCKSGAGNLEYLIVIDEIDKGLQLLLLPCYLYDHGVLGHIDYLAVVDSGDGHDSLPLIGKDTDLHQHKLAAYRIYLREIDDVDDVLKLAYLLFDLLEGSLIPVNSNCDARILGVQGIAAGEAVDIKTSSAEQTRHAAGNAVIVLYQHRQDLLLLIHSLYPS